MNAARAITRLLFFIIPHKLTHIITECHSLALHYIRKITHKILTLSNHFYPIHTSKSQCTPPLPPAPHSIHPNPLSPNRQREPDIKQTKNKREKEHELTPRKVISAVANVTQKHKTQQTPAPSRMIRNEKRRKKAQPQQLGIKRPHGKFARNNENEF